MPYTVAIVLPDTIEGITDASATRSPSIPRTRSSGLGLAFCKMVIDAHGGRIWVQSAEGQGSAFHFSLPLKPPQRVVRVSGASLTG